MGGIDRGDPLSRERHGHWVRFGHHSPPCVRAIRRGRQHAWHDGHDLESRLHDTDMRIALCPDRESVVREPDLVAVPRTISPAGTARRSGRGSRRCLAATSRRGRSGVCVLEFTESQNIPPAPRIGRFRGDFGHRSSDGIWKSRRSLRIGRDVHEKSLHRRSHALWAMVVRIARRGCRLGSQGRIAPQHA
jgi:hypothetical protein